MTQQILRVTDETTRAELEEALANLNHGAKRAQCIIGDADHPTPWDRAHRRMDGLLDEVLSKGA